MASYKTTVQPVAEPVSLRYQLTEIHRRVLERKGPAILIERPVNDSGGISPLPVLLNLFGTTERIALGLGLDEADLPALGEALAELRSPRAPRDVRGAWERRSLLAAALNTRTRSARHPETRRRCR